MAEQLIDGLLFLEDVARARISREPVELGTLARELLDELQAADPRREVAARVHDDLWVNADRKLARVALRHSGCIRMRRSRGQGSGWSSSAGSSGAMAAAHGPIPPPGAGSTFCFTLPR